jgi:hypothetical protein
LSYTGNNCLLSDIVIGCRRVPAPPAKKMPCRGFTESLAIRFEGPDYRVSPCIASGIIAPLRAA